MYYLPLSSQGWLCSNEPQDSCLEYWKEPMPPTPPRLWFRKWAPLWWIFILWYCIYSTHWLLWYPHVQQHEFKDLINCSRYTSRVSCFWSFHNNLAHLCVAVALPSICRARGQQMFPLCPSTTGASPASSLPCVSRATHMIASVSFKVFQNNWPMVSVNIPRHYAIVFQIKKVKRCSWDSLYPTRNIV